MGNPHPSVRVEWLWDVGCGGHLGPVKGDYHHILILLCSASTPHGMSPLGKGGGGLEKTKRKKKQNKEKQRHDICITMRN
jgi:hypothetical protein